MSVYTDDAGVSVASVISSVAEVLDKDEYSERVEGGVDVPVPRWLYSFAVLSRNLYIDWSPDSSFILELRSLIFLDLFIRAGIAPPRRQTYAS